MDIGELEKRIAVLEDIEAIKKLKARYCAVCDDNHNPEKITTLFAPDGIWEGAGVGAHQGHAAIRALFERFQQRIDELTAHHHARCAEEREGVERLTRVEVRVAQRLRL